MTDMEKRVEERAERIAKIYALTIEDSKNIWVDLAKAILIWELEARIEELKAYMNGADRGKKLEKYQTELEKLKGEA